MIVIRRPARPRVEIREASPMLPALVAPKLTSAEERERLVRDRSRRIRGEVEAEFREHGAKVFHDDPIRAVRGHVVGGTS